MTIETVASRLQIHDGDRLAVLGADEDGLETIQPLPDEIELVDDVAIADVVLAFAHTFEDFELRLGDVEGSSAAAHLWVLYPKDQRIDLEQFEEVADRNGFELTHQEPIDATWSAVHLSR